MKKLASTIVIYLIGKPGVGKYTIAKQLRQNNNFIICDNHLINNPIFELLQYDGYKQIPDLAWEVIDRIRENILYFLSQERNNNYVLTNCLAENEKDRAIYNSVQEMSQQRASLFVPVLLSINKEEHLKRLTRTERRDRLKSIDPKDAEGDDLLISISHPNLLKLNISELKADSVSNIIIEHIKSLNI